MKSSHSLLPVAGLYALQDAFSSLSSINLHLQRHC
jgi:hypothetical protein